MEKGKLKFDREKTKQMAAGLRSLGVAAEVAADAVRQLIHLPLIVELVKDRKWRIGDRDNL